MRLSLAGRSGAVGRARSERDEQVQGMSRFKDWAPHGVIPAVLLPFEADFAIDEAAYRKHLRDLAAVDGVAALTVNGHSSEVHACTPGEQRRVLAVTMDE